MESNGDKDQVGCNKEEDQKLIESAKGDLGEVREENERLKVLLAQLVNEYESLQMHFYDILRQDHNQQQHEDEVTNATTIVTAKDHNEENELVSLSLGFSSTASTKDQNHQSGNTSIKEDDKDLGELGLALGLDVRFDPSGEVEGTNNIVTIKGSSDDDEEGKEDEATEIWPPNKVLKPMRGTDTIEASQQAQLKKTRVSIRVRCDTQTMNDGCQWRKYGQKKAKGNPCPRAYYRCTVSPSCPVRKQVQRCAEDMSILITTYEGIHNHPLPLSATPMASTTSLAASMLQSSSRSSSSSQLTAASIFNSSTSPAYNFNNTALTYSSTSPISRPPPHHRYYFPNSSISTCTSYPTITLDLTSPPPPSSSSSLHHHHQQFSTFTSPSASQSLIYPYYDGGNCFSNGTVLLPHMNRSQSSGKQTLQQETIAAATKAITDNLEFQSAIAAGRTSYVGANTSSNNGGVGGFYSTSCSDKNGLDRTLSSSSSSRYMMNNNSVISSSSGININAQQGNMILFPPLPAASRSASGSGLGSVSSDKSNQILEQWKRKESNPYQ